MHAFVWLPMPIPSTWKEANIDIPPFRRTLELEEFITTAGDIIINLVKCEVWFENNVKCGKYNHVKFPNFVYFYHTQHSQILNVLLCVIATKKTTFCN
jgi:hypothetical protein